MRSPPPIRVFVSSTSRDLLAERGAVEKIIHRMRGTDFAGMEYFGSRDEDAATVSLSEVDGCDLYIGIIAGRYGSGITEREYDRARARGLPCLIYFKDDAAIAPDQRDGDAQLAQRLAAFKSRLAASFSGHLVTPAFSTPDQLAAAVATDVHRWLFDNYLVPALKLAAERGQARAVGDLITATRDDAALRAALASAKVPVGSDVLDSLLQLGSAVLLGQLLQGLNELPTDFGARIRNFLAAYLGAPGQPVPFGGREADVRRLNAWLDDPQARPYLLLAAEAGRGKSALLVHWSQRLLARSDIEVIFVPISIRYRTNLGSVVFAATAARLAAVYAEPLKAEADTPVEVWRGIVADYLGRPPPGGKRVVLILDGLDEAGDWEAGADLFPVPPPAGLRIVVSARLTESAPHAANWLERLGWQRQAVSRELAGLDYDGVADVLQRMGFPVEALSRRGDIVAKLLHLSNGDPILVKLYTDDLWTRGDAVARLEPEDLETIKPGLEGYFGHWWVDQQKLWGDGQPLRTRSVQALLNLLACAAGRLRAEDLLALAPAEFEASSWTIDDAMRPLERFVVGDGGNEGWIFSHPRFGAFLFDKLTPAEKRAWDARFLSFGEAVLASLESGALDPADAPPYLVQYYGTHLTRANAPVERWVALVSEPWKRAWEALEGGYSGFINDTERAWRAADDADRQAVVRGKTPAYLADEIRCALVGASVRSLARVLSPGILVKLRDEGIWTERRAIAFARQMPDVRARGIALMLLASNPHTTDRAALEREGRALIASLTNANDRLDTMAELYERSADVSIAAMLAEAKPITGDFARDRLLLRIAHAALTRGASDDSLVEVCAEVNYGGNELPVICRTLIASGRVEVAVRIAAARSDEWDREGLRIASALLAIGEGRCDDASRFVLVLEGWDRERRASVLNWLCECARDCGSRMLDESDAPSLVSLLTDVLRVRNRTLLHAPLRRIRRAVSARMFEHTRALIAAARKEIDTRAYLAALATLCCVADAEQRAALRGDIMRFAADDTTSLEYDDVGTNLIAALAEYPQEALAAAESMGQARHTQGDAGLAVVAEYCARAGDADGMRLVWSGMLRRSTRVQAFVANAERLAPPLREQLAQELMDGPDYLSLDETTSIAAHAAATRREAFLRTTLAKVRSDGWYESPASAMRTLEPLLTGTLLRAFLPLTQSIGDNFPQMLLLTALAALCAPDDADPGLAGLLERMDRETPDAEARFGQRFLVAMFRAEPERSALLLELARTCPADHLGPTIGGMTALACFLEPSIAGELERILWRRLFAECVIGEVVTALENVNGMVPAEVLGEFAAAQLASVLRTMRDMPAGDWDKRRRTVTRAMLLPAHERADTMRRLIEALPGDAYSPLAVEWPALALVEGSIIDQCLDRLVQADATKTDMKAAIVALAPYLAPRRERELVELARRLPNPARDYALAALLPYASLALEAALLPELRSDAAIPAWANLLLDPGAVHGVEPYQRLFDKLTQVMPAAWYAGFIAAIPLDQSLPGAMVVRRMITHLAVLPAAETLPLLRACLDLRHGAAREHVLLLLAALAPLIRVLGGDAAVTRVRVALRDVVGMFG